MGSVQDRVRLNLLRRGGQISDQPQRNGEFIQLEVWTQESDGAIDTRLARDLRHVDARFTQRTLGLGCRRSRVIWRHVLRDPAVQESLRTLHAT